MRLREELAEALAVNDGPTALRFPKGDVGEDIRAIERLDGVDVLHQARAASGALAGDVLLVGIGAFCGLAVDTAQRLSGRGSR